MSQRGPSCLQLPLSYLACAHSEPVLFYFH